jgi:hypothetical protein
VAGGIIMAYAARPQGLLDSPTFTFARAATYEIMNLYAVEMAAVFMISTSTLAMRSGFIPRWIAFLGFACALLLLFSGRYMASFDRLERRCHLGNPILKVSREGLSG